MELDVHLTRDGDEPWGFQLIGGERGMLLTMDKVYPSTPAHVGGLQPGDIVLRIGDKLTSDLSLEDATRLVAEAVGSLAFGICRGLYDPVLDDYEPIYETDLGDLDRQSATEVQTTPNDIDIEQGTYNNPEIQELSFQRSLTTSPYPKPYRPFSTEPLEIPPLEDPIILNPRYKDGFPPNAYTNDLPYIDNLLGNIDDVLKDSNRFKLPISKQYDPEYGKRVRNIIENICKDSNNIEINELKLGLNNERNLEIELNELETNLTVVNAENIEKTAINIVDESIERAVSVIEEIKREVEEERASMSREATTVNYIENIDSTVKNIELQSEDKLIESETINEKSNESLTEQNYTKYQDEINETNLTQQIHSEENEVYINDSVLNNIETSEFIENVDSIHSNNVITEESIETELNEERDSYIEQKETANEMAYKIGLQTIPNIKGMVQSSHFDLLLRTFFIHLTDVMVALSRFLLTQPIKDLDSNERVIKEKFKEQKGYAKTDKVNRKVSNDNKSESKIESKNAVSNLKTESKIEATRNAVANMKNEFKTDRQIEQNENLITNSVNTEYIEHEKKRVSGVEMSQRTQKKSKELTERMEAVITEFENKAGLEEDRRRSRSRSRLDDMTTETIDKTQSKTAYENKAINITENHIETEKTGKQMYVAIVESHVYTNKDAVLASTVQTTDFTEKSTDKVTVNAKKSEITKNTVDINNVEAKIEKVELAKVTSEAMVQTDELNKSIEKCEISVEKEINNASVNKTVSNIIESKDINSQAIVTSEENHIEESVDIAAEQVIEKSVIKNDVSNELLTIASENIQVADNSKLTTFETYEAKTKSLELEIEDNFKSTAIQATNTVLEEANNITELKLNEKQATARVEQLAIATAEITDVVTDSELKTLKTAEIEAKKAAVKAEETFKTAAVEITDTALETFEEEHVFKLEKEATIKDTAHLAVAGITEVSTEVCKSKTYDEENAELKIVKHEYTDIENTVLIAESNIHKSLEVNYKSLTEKASVKTMIESDNFIMNGDQNNYNDNIMNGDRNSGDETSNGDPTTPIAPPTPLTDEYVFKLEIPLPKSRSSTPFIEEIIDDPNIVKKKLVPQVEIKIEDQIIYNPPLLSPTEGKKLPVYVKPGLRGGCVLYYTEYIREIERKSSLLASAIDQTIKSIEEYKEEVGIEPKGTEENPTEEAFEKIVKYSLSKGLKLNEEDVKSSEEVIEEGVGEIELPGLRPVQFKPESGKETKNVEVVQEPEEGRQSKLYMDDKGDPIGTDQGIIDGLQDATVDEDTAKELGKPGIPEEKVIEINSGDDMLREAHVMGLKRVISSHMHRPEDVEECPKIKPLVNSLKDSEVIKALNEEITLEEKKKSEEKKWTTFLQKPRRAAPKPKFGYYGYIEQNLVEEEPYKVKIVKQPKPKVAPDYKPEDFDTGPLPWEERALNEPPASPVKLEDPILIPEETPEFLEAVDPLPESEVPDLEDTGIPLPSPIKIVTVEIVEEKTVQEEPVEEVVTEEEIVEEDSEEMDVSVEKKAERLIESVKSMVDPNAPVDQQLAQMRAQLAALAQLPCVIQQSLETLTKHLTVMGQQQETMQYQETQHESHVEESQMEESQEYIETNYTENNEESKQETENQCVVEEMLSPIEETKEEMPQPTEEGNEEERTRQVMIEEEQEKQKKQSQLEQESRLLKQRSTPRVGKPKRMFGPPNPEERPLVLPGGRRWRGPKDAFDEQLFAETVQSQSELIQGKVMGYIPFFLLGYRTVVLVPIEDYPVEN